MPGFRRYIQEKQKLPIAKKWLQDKQDPMVMIEKCCLHSSNKRRGTSSRHEVDKTLLLWKREQKSEGMKSEDNTNVWSLPGGWWWR